MKKFITSNKNLTSPFLATNFRGEKMVAKKPRVVIIGAGLAGLTAANKLYTSSDQHFDLCILEGGNRIGGRINTSEFNGEKIELGATWIHGIQGSPLFQIAQEINALESDQPWECMDNVLDRNPITISENGVNLENSLVDPICTLFKNLKLFAKGELGGDDEYFDLAAQALKEAGDLDAKVSVGAFLQKGFGIYLDSMKDDLESKKLIQESIFDTFENILRSYTSAGDLSTLDYAAEPEFNIYPGEEITIAKGYTSIIESLASVLPCDLIQLGKKVTKIEWQPENVHGSGPVKLHISDGSIMNADHVIVTVSLGVLKAGIRKDSSFFDPPLPQFKIDAISKLGFGIVNKLFAQLSPAHDQEKEKFMNFPYFQMAFEKWESESRDKRIPWWMRKASSFYPIHENSSILLSWFAGKEALELEKLNHEEIINGVSATISSFLTPAHDEITQNFLPNPLEICNGCDYKITKVLKSQWGTDPLFSGSYSYVAVGSSGDDFDSLSEPMPGNGGSDSNHLQILFAGEATHRYHYSTTHGAYLSGVREANRLIQHYLCVGL